MLFYLRRSSHVIDTVGYLPHRTNRLTPIYQRLTQPARRSGLSKQATLVTPGTISEPAYIYILWLAPDAQLRPIYPWEKGDWEFRPSRELQHAQLSLPSPSSAWTIESGESVAATVFVFTARERFPHETTILSLLPEFKPQTGEASDQVYWFRDGQEVRPPGRKSRAPSLSKPTPLADPVLLNQELVFHRLGRFFNGHAAICIPIDAD